MADFYTVLKPIVRHFIKQVYAVTPVGEGTYKWRHWEGPEPLVGNGNRTRLFDVYMDPEQVPEEPNAVQNSEKDYDVFLNIDICYEALDAHTILGMQDYNGIDRKVELASVSGLTGYNFSKFQQPVWIEADNDTHFRYMRIPVMVRVSVTR